MGFNNHLIPPKPGDPGTAAAVIDLQRRIQSMESTAGDVGGGATITGPLIETSDSNPRLFMQGPLNGPEGLFATDASGNYTMALTDTSLVFYDTSSGQSVQSMALESGAGGLAFFDSAGQGILWILPNFGISIQTSNRQWSQITWQTGNLTDALVGAFPNQTVGANFLRMAVTSPDQGYQWKFDSKCANGATSGTQLAVAITHQSTGVVGPTSKLADANGNGTWPGAVSAGSYVTTSDEQVKKDIAVLEGSLLTGFDKLKPVSFVRAGQHEEHTEYGLVAQDVQRVFPDLVHVIPSVAEESEDLLGINMGSLLGLAIAKIQELEGRLKTMEDQHGKSGAGDTAS